MVSEPPSSPLRPSRPEEVSLPPLRPSLSDAAIPDSASGALSVMPETRTSARTYLQAPRILFPSCRQYSKADRAEKVLNIQSIAVPTYEQPTSTLIRCVRPHHRP